MDEWSDTKKWLMDILKSFIVFGAIAIVSLLVIDNFNHIRESKRERLKELIQLKIDLATDFDKASRTYFGDAYDAFKENANWDQEERETIKPKPPNVSLYEDRSYGEWTFYLSLVKRHNPELQHWVNEAKKASDDMHVIYRTADRDNWKLFKESRKNAKAMCQAIIDRLYEEHDKAWDELVGNDN